LNKNTSIELKSFAQILEAKEKINIKLSIFLLPQEYEILEKSISNIIVEIEFKYNTFSFDKSLCALKKFTTELNCNKFVKNVILSTSNTEIKQIYDDYFSKTDSSLISYQYLNAKSRISSTKEINNSQELAVTKAIINPVSLIIGPPGTGKTLTAVEIVKYWLYLYKDARILLTSDSNIAIDKLYLELFNNKIDCVRIGNYNKEKNSISNSYNNNELFSQKSKSNISLTINNSTKQYSFTEAQNKISSKKVVCTTLFGALSELLTNIIFKKVIIDECSQATEINSIFPLSHFCDQLVLIGDYKQLPPCVFSKNAILKGLSISLFERLSNLGIDSVMLNEQYRMHPSISLFPSSFFYEGKLLNSSNTNFYSPIPGFSWPGENRWAFIDSGKLNSQEEQSGMSLINLVEAEMVCSILENEYIENYPFKEIGVITPYDAQKQIITSMVVSKFGGKICDVDTVDGYQGMEKDLIIISLVRANTTASLGFLKDYRRLNVSLTRAKKGLIIIGNVKTLETDKVYNSLILHARSIGSLI
jgi:superfamily I DNA and/or RNA helicase